MRDNFLKEISKTHNVEGKWVEYRAIFMVKIDGTLLVEESRLSQYNAPAKHIDVR